MEIDLEWIEDEVGGKPYGIDLIVPAKYAGSDEGGMSVGSINEMIPSEHREYLDQILAKYDVPPLEDSSKGQFNMKDDAAAPMSADSQMPNLDIAMAFQALDRGECAGSTTSGHDRPLRRSWYQDGSARWQGPTCRASRECRRRPHHCSGYEAGGHTGEIASMVLIPEIVDAVGDTPVLGAGGIGRGRQMAAAMALGAQGVWCGSVWLTTEEAETHPVVKEKMLAATSSDTIRSRSRTGKHARQLKSAWTEEWENPETPMPLGMPMQPVLIDEAISRINRAAHREGSGAEKLANYFVGQIVGTMNKSKPTTQVVYEMIEEFIEATESLNTQINS